MAEQPENQRCERCRFWISVNAEVPAALETRLRWHAACHRFPPHPGQMNSGWPQTRGNQWCGEFQPEEPDNFTELGTQLARQVILGDHGAARALVDHFNEEQE